jgi:hypothetical protein
MARASHPFVFFFDNVFKIYRFLDIIILLIVLSFLYFMFFGRISSSDLSLEPQLEGEVEFALENLNMQITALNLLLLPPCRIKRLN